VLAPFKEAALQGRSDLTFAQFCAVMCEARKALDEMSTQDFMSPLEAIEESAFQSLGAAAKSTGINGLLAFKGQWAQTVRKSTMSDESFANPLRRYLKEKSPSSSVLGTALGAELDDDRIGLSWLESCGMSLDDESCGMSLDESCGMSLDDGVQSAIMLGEAIDAKVHSSLIAPIIKRAEDVSVADGR
jgi:hypothetical protein